MAFGVISAFAHQRVTIGTEISLNIRITGNPEHAYVEGLLEGFYTNWEDPILQVRGVGTRLINNVPFTVKALKGSEEPLTRAGVISVVPAAPVITSPGRQKFVRGIENSFVVKISNSPSKVRAVGPWLGMKADSHPDGVRISGIVPEVSHAVPGADQKIRVTAESGALTDAVEIAFDLLNSFIYSSAGTTDIYRLQLNESDKTVSSDLRFTTDRDRTYLLASDDTYIYLTGFHRLSGNLRRVPINTGDGQTVTASKINDVSLDASGMAVDGDSLHLFKHAARNENDKILVINKSNASTIKEFSLNVNIDGGALAIHGDDLIVLVTPSRGGQSLRWYDKNTANGGTATHTREVTLPNTNRSYRDITVFDNKVYLTNISSKTITSIDIEKGTVVATYSLPSSLPGMHGITIVVK